MSETGTSSMPFGDVENGTIAPAPVTVEEFRAEMKVMQAALRSMEERLNAVFAPSAEVVLRFEDLPKDAKAAAKAMAAARARRWFTAKEYAAVIGRRSQYVSDLCAQRRIQTFGGGKKPFRIPLDEYEDWKLGVSGVFRDTKKIRRHY